MRKFLLFLVMILMSVPVLAEYNFDAMSLDEVKQLEKAAGDYYDEMTSVKSEMSSEISTLIEEAVGQHTGGTVSSPLFGYSIKRQRDVYTLEDTVKVKDAAGNSKKHTVEASFLYNGKMAFTKLIVDGSTLISLAADEVPEVEYADITAKKLIDDLNKNALAAKDKYKGQYVAVSGLVSTIDSSGDYIAVAPDKYSFNTIHCSIKSDAVLKKVMELSSGSKVTVYGKITDVGEVLGYYLDIHDIK